MKHTYLSWHDLEELMTKLVFKLNTPYDTILMVARGGIIPGGMIAEALKMRDVLTASLFYQDSDVQSSNIGTIVSPSLPQFAALGWPNFVQFPSDDLLEGRKVLIVDNLWNQGRKVMAVRSRVEAAGGFPEVAVLHWKQENSLYSEQSPDHYVEIAEADDFIHYPWQRIDDSDYRVKATPLVPVL
ncbi:MAG: phosphoribosyltransferase [Chloroflexota bacterium]